MKKIIITTILLLLVILNTGYTQNTMRIDTLSGKPGDTLTYSVKIDNVKSFVAYQLDIQIPTYLTYVNNSAALTSRANGHNLGASLINSTLLRVLAYSLTMNPFFGNTGAVLTFKCYVTGNIPGVYNLGIVTPVIADSLNANILTASYSGRFTLLLPKITFSTSAINFGTTLLGTNKDNSLTIYNQGTSNLTITKITSNSGDIRLLDSSGFTLTAGNNISRTVRLYANTRGVKNASFVFYSNDPSDSVHTVTATGTVFTTNELYLNTVTSKYGFVGTMKIRMKNFETVNGFQTSITLPASINYVAGSVVLNPARINDHIISASVLSGNILKIVSYSPTNKPYLSNDSTIAQFNFIAKGNPGSYSIPITEGIISDTNGINVISNVYAGSISVISPVIGLPASILFDTTSYTDTTRKQLTIQNTGNDTLLISGINSTESSFANETTLPVKIPPSGNRIFTIRLTNQVNGLHTGNLIISHNDSLRNPGSVAVSGVIYRPTRLRVTSSDFNSRDTSYLPFNIDNKLPIVAFQFDVTLPSQFSYIPNSAILTSRANGHLVSTSTLGNGDIRVIAYSMSQNRFYGDSGDVVKLKLAVNADTGVFNVTVKNVIISDSNNVNISTGSDNGTIRISPYPPTLISPLNGSVGNPLSLSLIWGRSPFAFYYHLQVSTDSLFNNIIINDSTRTDTTYALSNLSILQSYYWRVRVKNYSGMYRFSNPWRFRTIGYPTQVILSSPANNSTDQPLNITFKWFKAIDQTLSPLTVSKYWFEYSTDSNFVNNVIRDSTLTDTTKTITGAANFTKYYWRVKALNQMGWGGFSSVWNLSTGYVVKTNFISVMSPQFMPCGPTTSYRAPVTFRATITGLTPNKTYRYYNQATLSSNLGTSNIAPGSIIFANSTTGSFVYTNNGGSLTTSGMYGTFVSGSSGSYTGWFAFIMQPNSMYTEGNYILPLVVVGDTNGAVSGKYALNDSIKNLSYSTSSGPNYGTGIYGISLGIPKSFVALYDNETGTGKPLSMTYVDNQEIVPVYLAQYYYNNVFYKNGRWGAFLPNILPNGVRRVEQRSITDGSIMSYNTDADGIWPSGVNTINPNIGSVYTAIALANNDAPLLNAPVLISPVNSTVDLNLTPLISWLSSATASSYNLKIATDTAFATTVYDTSSITGLYINVPSGKLNTNTKYYWRVSANNVSGTSLYSQVWNFTTAPNAPNIPVLALPFNSSINQPTTLTFKWYKAIETITDKKTGIINNLSKINKGDSPDAISLYWFEYSIDSTFAAVNGRDSTLTDTTKTLSGLNNITKYYWRVKAKNQTGWGGFSNAWNFTTIVPIPSVPLLLSPLNNSTGNPLSLSLVWNKPQYASGYNVVLATDTGFISIVLNDSTLTDSIKTLTNLNPLTTYYWKVRAKNVAGWGSFSSAFNFKTVGSPTQVVLSAPANNSLNQPVNIMFKWFKAADQTNSVKSSELRVKSDKNRNSPSAVLNYWYELATDAGFTSIVVRDSSVTDTIKAVTGLSNTTTYYWRVKAKNEIGWAIFSSVWSFTTIVPVPGVPVLISPVFGSTGNPLNLNLVWNKPSNSINFHVILATDTGFTSIILNDSTLTDSVKALTNLTPLTTYYWKVRAKSLSGWSGFASAFNFKTVGTPTTVVLSTPANNSTGQPTSITFKWFKAVDQTNSVKSSELRVKSNGKEKNKEITGDSPDAVSKYWFELASDSLFTNIITRDSLLTDTTKAVTSLNTGTNYFWRVKAKNQIGWGGFSSIFKFTTLIPMLSLNLKVYLEGFWDGTTHVSDTVMVYLANATTPFAYADTAKVILSGTGTASMNFNRVTTGSYYIVVNHRNHLETWSKLPQSFVGGTPLSYDFTTAMTQAYGDNMKQVGSAWVFFGGDANRDGSIDALDVIYIVNQFGTQGYLEADFNGDQDVTGMDVALFVPNFGMTKIIPSLVLKPVIKKGDYDLSRIVKKVNKLESEKVMR